MAEAKYGRLFTEADVKRIVRHVVLLYAGKRPTEGEAADDTMGVIDYFDGMHEAKPGEHDALTFPADEPLFLLRGQDVTTPEVIRAYVVEAARAGASVEHREAAAAAGRYVAGWQHANADRVKVPD